LERCGGGNRSYVCLQTIKNSSLASKLLDRVGKPESWQKGFKMTEYTESRLKDRQVERQIDAIRLLKISSC
jgi:hypothetical protein